MRNLLAVGFLGLVGMNAVAGPFGLFNRRGGSGGNYQAQGAGQVDGELGSAQGVANRMARLNVMRHFGGWGYSFEGVGCASTPEAAIANTCKPHGGAPREIGVAQGSNGLFYACRRW